MTDEMNVDPVDGQDGANKRMTDAPASRSRAHVPSADKDRNRRMFGRLLNDMGKIQKTTEKLTETERERKKREVEERVRRKLEEERERAARAAQDSDDMEWDFGYRDPYDYKVYDDSDAHYLRTNTRPQILYLPAHLDESEERIIADQLDEEDRRIIS